MATHNTPPHRAITKTKDGTMIRTIFVLGVLSFSSKGEGLSETKAPNIDMQMFEQKKRKTKNPAILISKRSSLT